MGKKLLFCQNRLHETADACGPLEGGPCMLSDAWNRRVRGDDAFSTVLIFVFAFLILQQKRTYDGEPERSRCCSSVSF